MKKRKIPLRKCVGCGEQKAKRELIRIVRSPQGQVALDRTGKAPGRGAYVCPKESCLKKAIKTNAVQRALQVELSRDQAEALLEAINDES
jgi:hypothetical protein